MEKATNKNYIRKYQIEQILSIKDQGYINQRIFKKNIKNKAVNIKGINPIKLKVFNAGY